MARSQKKEEAEDLQPADELEPELTVLKPGIDPNEIDASPAPQLDPTLFPLVGIGASAGGLEALEEFFSSMPQGMTRSGSPTRPTASTRTTRASRRPANWANAASIASTRKRRR
jgi:hypothetical protein